MTARLPFTKASVRKRIAAAQEAGLTVTGIAADGTVLTLPLAGGQIAAPDATLAPDASKWEDVEA